MSRSTLLSPSFSEGLGEKENVGFRLLFCCAIYGPKKDPQEKKIGEIGVRVIYFFFRNGGGF